MTITKQEALRLLVKIGANDLIDDAARTLPDEIDVDRDQNLLARFGLENCGELIDRFGAGLTQIRPTTIEPPSGSIKYAWPCGSTHSS